MSGRVLVNLMHTSDLSPSISWEIVNKTIVKLLRNFLYSPKYHHVTLKLFTWMSWPGQREMAFILRVLDVIPLVCIQIKSPKIIQLLIWFIFTPENIHLALMSVMILVNDRWMSCSTLRENIAVDFFPFTWFKIELKCAIDQFAFYKTAENKHIVFMYNGRVFVTGLGCVFFNVLVRFVAYNFPNEFV